MIEAALKWPLRQECMKQGEGIEGKIREVRGLADLVIMFISTTLEMKS